MKLLFEKDYMRGKLLKINKDDESKLKTATDGKGQEYKKWLN